MSPRSLIRARDVRARLGNSPDTSLTEDQLTQGRYFEADCLAGDVVGDFVSVTGAPVGGFFQTTKTDISLNETTPTVGVIVSKETSTRCLVQSFGVYITTGLTTGARYWVGSDSRLTAVRPAGVAQSVGAALSPTELLLRLEVAAASSSSWLPPPDNSEDTDATYFYFGWEDVGGSWLVRRQLRADATTMDATDTDNPSHLNLTSAWASKETLIYV